MTVRARVRRLEKELGVASLYHLDVVLRPGEVREDGLQRTLRERGLRDENVGNVAFWPIDPVPMTSDCRVDPRDVDKLRGYRSLEERLAELPAP